MATSPYQLFSRIVLVVVFAAAIAAGVAGLAGMGINGLTGVLLVIVGLGLMALFDRLGWNPVFRRQR